MLNAIVHGKRRGSGLEGMTHRLARATGSEDLLTALVFERIGYLPDEAASVFWDALLPEGGIALGPILRMEFWPRLELDDQIVEPDVLLQTANALMVVEAKRWDQMDLQYVQQVAREILAVSAAEPDASALPMLVLLVGGRQDTSPRATAAFESQVQELLLGERPVNDIAVAAVRWTDVLKALDATADLHRGCSRIRDDVQLGLQFHGLTRQSEVRLQDLLAVGIASQTFPVRTPEPQAEPKQSCLREGNTVAHALRLGALAAVNITSTSFRFSK